MSQKTKPKAKDRPLPDERYDEKLFKQAYKAAKEAREVEKREKEKKALLKVLLFTLLPILVISLGIFIFSLIEPRSEYLVTGEYPRKSSFSKIYEENPSSVSYQDISFSNISAQSAIVFESNTGEILFEKEIESKSSVASLTKILSAMVVLDYFPLDSVVEVSMENIPVELDWQLGLKEGDRITVENLLKSMLISSYNDAAYVIANAYPDGGYDGFVEAMNQKAEVLQMSSSHFSNPAGIDQEGNYSSVWDIALLVSAAMREKKILETVSLGSEVVNWSSEGEVFSKKIFTSNQLYGVNPYSKGFKTGTTDLAKQCFVGYFEYSNGNRVVTIVLGSEDRFEDTANLEGYARAILR